VVGARKIEWLPYHITQKDRNTKITH
jgi:hypothetical protein